jgi:hypothetical protein
MCFRSVVAAAIGVLALHTLGRAPAQREANARPELGLAIHARWRSCSPKHRWWRPQIDAELVNESSHTTFRVVKPGDGSDAGWREPYVYLTSQVQNATDSATDVLLRGIGRCGNYSPNWLPDVVDLAPGQSIPLQWFHCPETCPIAQRVSLHYEYRARPATRGTGSDDERPLEPLENGGLGRMLGCAPFHVESDPLSIELEADEATKEQIESALRLRLRLSTDGARVHWPTLQAEAWLDNVSIGRAVRFVQTIDGTSTMRNWTCLASEGEPALTLEVETCGADGAWQSAILYTASSLPPSERDWRKRIRSLAPGATARLVFPRPVPTPQWDFHWKTRVRLRAVYEYRALPSVDPRTGTAMNYPECLGEMAAIPPFKVTSEWIERELEP